MPGAGGPEPVTRGGLELENHPTHHFQNPVGTSKAGTPIGGTGDLTRFDDGHGSSTDSTGGNACTSR